MKTSLSVLSASLFLVSMLTLAAARPARASHYAIVDVPRLVPTGNAAKLKKAGVNTTEELLDKAARAKDRKALAKSSGLGAPTLLDLARRCDLLRIKGVGSEVVLLLEASGVKTTADLAKKDPGGLTATMSTANKEKKISEKLPAEDQLQHWIEEAKKLPQVLEAK